MRPHPPVPCSALTFDALTRSHRARAARQHRNEVVGFGGERSVLWHHERPAAQPSVLTEVRTVGHGTLSAEAFASLLDGADVARVADVRSFPGSRHNPQFGREQMEQWVPDAGSATSGCASWAPSSSHIRIEACRTTQRCIPRLCRLYGDRRLPRGRRRRSGSRYERAGGSDVQRVAVVAVPSSFAR